MNTDPIKVTVVVPFYQREAGILQRAIQSALAQSLRPGVDLDILVVDDGSPLSAEDELARLAVPSRHVLRVVSQPNGGPGAARNKALDLLDPETTKYVAFLDSDDEWQPYHISTALSALDGGHDFYFCDHFRYDSEQSWLERSAVARGWKSGKRRPAPIPLDRWEDIFSIASQPAFDAFVEEYLSQTSTVVYRFDRHPSLRFDTDLRSAGEDHMFWLALARKSSSVAFSTRKNVSCGRGVNIYFSAFDWDSSDAIARNGYLLIFRLKLRQMGLTSTQAAKIDVQIAEDGKTLAYLLARNMAKGRMPDWRVLSQVLKISLPQAVGLPLRLLPMLSKRERNRIAAKRQSV